MISPPQSNETTAQNDANSPRINGHSATTTSPQPEQRGERSGNRGGQGPKAQGERRNWWQGSSLRTKATVLAIALGTIPVLVVGITDYFLSSGELQQNVSQAQEELAVSLGDKVGRFMFERYGDIQIVASLSVFADPTVSKITTPQHKEALLTRFEKVYGAYDSVAVFDLNGDLIAKTKGQLDKNVQGKSTNNIKDQDHFQEVLRTNRPVISQPSISKTTGKVNIFFTSPIKDTVTGKTIAVARSRMPADVLDKVLGTEEERLSSEFKGVEYHLIDAGDKFFVATEKDQIGRSARDDFPGFEQIKAAGKPMSEIIVDQIDKQEQLTSITAVEKIEGMPELGWTILLGEGTEIAFADRHRVLLTLLIRTGLTALVVTAIALYLGRRATRPIVDAADAVEKLGEGELDTRIAVEGQDEVAKLGNNINRMAGQIQNLIVEQVESTRQQLAAQEKVGRQQAENAEQQRLAKENLQKRALELLTEVDPVSRGDLTIRANVTEDEIGTVADSYNATVGSLRKIVAQVQAAARQMAETTSTSEVSAQGLSAEALRQTEEITAALDQLQEMSSSIRAVAASAEQAEAAVQQATQTVNEGDAAMNRTVEGIVAIRETVAETSKKVKRLGESSQKISRVVNLIGKFADQTNLLALNASIEAALAGAEGRGFAVVANEVRSLARQSAEATAEIEKLVADIQIETNEVVAAMETGTEQVVTGTKLVDETRQSLNKITAVSTQISGLVQAIAQAAVAQSKASESVTLTMSDVAAISNKTSTEANRVSTSFKDLLAVAQELQTSAGQFKVS